MKAWVISLNPESREVTQLINSLRSSGLDTQPFKAVDGRKSFPELEPGENIRQLKSLVNRREPLTRSELGCYLSHYRAVKAAYQSGLSHIAIFEDDIAVENNLQELFEAIRDLGDDAHLVRLMSLRRRKRKTLKMLTSTYQLTRPMRGALGTQGYVLNRAGMKKIVDYGSDITMAIDKLYDSFFLFGLKCYSIEPHAIHELPSPSNVVKTDNNIDNRILIKLGWHLNKLYRSLWRHSHRLKHFSEFWPATNPPKDFGKTDRIH